MRKIPKRRALPTAPVFCFTLLVALFAGATACRPDHLAPGEIRLRNIRMLTDGGQNAEAYFSFDESRLSFQSRTGDMQCDQIYVMDLSGERRRRVSNGAGATTRDGDPELYIMRADGSDMRQITNFGRASFASFFHPDGRRIIFSSNMQSDNPRNFDLYLIGVDGSGLERITYHESFDGFPMFNRAGTQLVFASNRSHKQPGETNIFLADWTPDATRR
jgi:Tol biopolymer transport system component